MKGVGHLILLFLSGCTVGSLGTATGPASGTYATLTATVNGQAMTFVGHYAEDCVYSADGGAVPTLEVVGWTGSSDSQGASLEVAFQDPSLPGALSGEVCDLNGASESDDVGNSVAYQDSSGDIYESSVGEGTCSGMAVGAFSAANGASITGSVSSAAPTLIFGTGSATATVTDVSFSCPGGLEVK